MIGLGLGECDCDMLLLGVIKILNVITHLLQYVGIGVVDEFVAEEEYRYTYAPAGRMHSNANHEMGIISKATSQEEISCAVCLNDMEKNDEIWKLHCSHIFHKPCLDEWIGLLHWTCPLCRASLMPPGNDIFS